MHVPYQSAEELKGKNINNEKRIHRKFVNNDKNKVKQVIFIIEKRNNHRDFC